MHLAREVAQVGDRSHRCAFPIKTIVEAFYAVIMCTFSSMTRWLLFYLIWRLLIHMYFERFGLGLNLVCDVIHSPIYVSTPV